MQQLQTNSRRVELIIVVERWNFPDFLNNLHLCEQRASWNVNLFVVIFSRYIHFPSSGHLRLPQLLPLPLPARSLKHMGVIF